MITIEVASPPRADGSVFKVSTERFNPAVTGVCVCVYTCTGAARGFGVMLTVALPWLPSTHVVVGIRRRRHRFRDVRVLPC